MKAHICNLSPLLLPKNVPATLFPYWWWAAGHLVLFYETHGQDEMTSLKVGTAELQPMLTAQVTCPPCQALPLPLRSPQCAVRYRENQQLQRSVTALGGRKIQGPRAETLGQPWQGEGGIEGRMGQLDSASCKKYCMS